MQTKLFMTAAGSPPPTASRSSTRRRSCRPPHPRRLGRRRRRRRPRRPRGLRRWPRMTGAERAVIQGRWRRGIRDRLPELARLEVIDNGKPLPEAEWDSATPRAARLLRRSRRGAGRRGRGDRLSDARFTPKAVREPLGVAVGIVPWNYPLLMAVSKVAPALAAGCAMVLKPSEWTRLPRWSSGPRRGGRPAPGVLNIVTGLGAEVGQALVDQPRQRAGLRPAARRGRGDPEMGRIKADIAFGGVFYARIDVDQIGLGIVLEAARALAEAGTEIKSAFGTRRVEHPGDPEPRRDRLCDVPRVPAGRLGRHLRHAEAGPRRRPLAPRHRQFGAAGAHACYPRALRRSEARRRAGADNLAGLGADAAEAVRGGGSRSNRRRPGRGCAARPRP